PPPVMITGGTGGGGGAPDSGAPEAPIYVPPPDAAIVPPPPAIPIDPAQPADTAPPDVMMAPPPDAMAALEVGPSACATAQEITTKILLPKCANCHSAATPTAALDLQTAGARPRLLDVPARGCSGKVLVTVGAEVGGYLFDKLAGP